MRSAELHRPPTYAGVTVQALRRFSGRDAFRQGGVATTYSEAHDQLARIVTVLAELGVSGECGVGVLSGNRPEVCLAQVAPGFLGSRYTALHPLGSLEDHLHMCDEAELRVLIVEPMFSERAEALLASSETVEHVLTFGPADVGSDLLALMGAASPAPLDTDAIDPDDIAWLLYTGGTTGAPKAVQLTQRAVGHMAVTVPVAWDIPRAPRYLACAPITHAASLLVTPALISGGTVILQRGWDPEAWLAELAHERASLAFVVPAMIYSLLDHPGLAGADTSSLETVMYGASPISPERLAEAIERLGPVFCQLYGQTECMGLVTSMSRDEHRVSNPERLASCGQPIPGAVVKILTDDGSQATVGEPGEICVRGPHVMTGYWKQPELTADTLAGGWLHTGDIAVESADGFITIVDRKKDMIVTGGYNVFPREVEDVLMAHPSVASAAVFGVPDPKWGEAVKAVVVPRPDRSVDIDELIALVRERKGSIQTPKAVEVRDALPLTGVGKIDKKLLREQHWADARQRVG